MSLTTSRRTLHTLIRGTRTPTRWAPWINRSTSQPARIHHTQDISTGLPRTPTKIPVTPSPSLLTRGTVPHTGISSRLSLLSPPLPPPPPPLLLLLLLLLPPPPLSALRRCCRLLRPYQYLPCCPWHAAGARRVAIRWIRRVMDQLPCPRQWVLAYISQTARCDRCPPIRLPGRFP